MDRQTFFDTTHDEVFVIQTHIYIHVSSLTWRLEYSIHIINLCTCIYQFKLVEKNNYTLEISEH